MANETPAREVDFGKDETAAKPAKAAAAKAVEPAPKPAKAAAAKAVEPAPVAVEEEIVSARRPKYGKVRVIVSASPTGDTRPIKLPDPDHPERGSKVEVPRLVETVIDVRTLNRLKRMVKVIHKPVYSNDPDKGRVIVGHREEHLPLAHCIVLGDAE